MAPLLRRSWAPRGHPPPFQQKVGHREKVSVAAALWLSPGWDRLHLAYQTLVNSYFSNVEVADFLSEAVEGLPYPLLVLWDGGPMHKGHALRQLVAQAQRPPLLERLPANAPKLMPVEPLWDWLKYGRLCNFAPRNAAHLNEAVIHELEAIRENHELLSHFWYLSDLPMPRTLLS